MLEQQGLDFLKTKMQPSDVSLPGFYLIHWTVCYGGGLYTQEYLEGQLGYLKYRWMNIVDIAMHCQFIT